MDVEELGRRRSERVGSLNQFRCCVCGYGASRPTAPERCPICGGSTWEHEGWKLFSDLPKDLRSTGSRIGVGQGEHPLARRKGRGRE
jgi:rubredoxin